MELANKESRDDYAVQSSASALLRSSLSTDKMLDTHDHRESSPSVHPATVSDATRRKIDEDQLETTGG